MDDLFKCTPERLEIALSKLYRWEWDELLGEEPKEDKAWRDQRDAAIALIEEQFGPTTQNWLWNKHGLGRSFSDWAAWRKETREMSLKQSRWSIENVLLTALDIGIQLAGLAAILWILSRI